MVFVDGDNNVVQPLTLDAQLAGNCIYQWALDGVLIPDADESIYIVNTASPNGEDRVFTVTAQSVFTNCSASQSIVVHQSSGVPSPLGPLFQTFNPGETLADLTVAGTDVKWYNTTTNKSTTAVPLPLSTLLTDGMTYYASQTVGGIESSARLPVTVQAALGVPTEEKLVLQYAPNPVKDVLTIDSNAVLQSIAVYNVLGQKVFEQSLNSHHSTIDLSSLRTGNYIAKLQGEALQQTIRIIKQ